MTAKKQGVLAFVTQDGMGVFVEEQSSGEWRAATVPVERPVGWHGPIQSVARPTMAQAAVTLGVRMDVAVATALRELGRIHG